MNNLEYFNYATKDVSAARKDSICMYLVGAASILIEDQKKWQEIVDDAVRFFDHVYADKMGELK